MCRKSNDVAVKSGICIKYGGGTKMVYLHTCDNCDYLFDVDRPVGSEWRNIKCPHCESLDTKQIYSIGGIQFNGTGFYSTDNKK